jgi:hypothetical protein
VLLFSTGGDYRVCRRAPVGGVRVATASRREQLFANDLVRAQRRGLPIVSVGQMFLTQMYQLV